MHVLMHNVLLRNTIMLLMATFINMLCLHMGRVSCLHHHPKISIIQAFHMYIVCNYLRRVHCVTYI